MRSLVPAFLALVLLAAALAGCTRETGGGEAKYLHLFNTAWAKCNHLGLYEVRVESVAKRPDGNKVVTVRYLYDNGMVPDQGRAAMLVAPENRLADSCVINLGINRCLCDEVPGWRVGP
ncbi:hypothetical protein [Desulfovibrio sp. TomC]|uniref:hypothetical protein n=1 Tax=Desulfovibrio sp. TomC TaxID=1562888 RepID=UPI0005757543|nr:hypothetical protein [Desulfovibrio sp. TomC]KHK00791.1 hypothetical protein NY78_3799 [Desulfovibrio sp. TomC]